MNNVARSLIQKREKGFISGCLTFIIVIMLIIGALLYWARSKVASYIIEYTETSPLAFVSQSIPEEELNQIANRISTFVDALKNDTMTSPLELTSRDINGMIAGLPKLVSPHLEYLETTKEDGTTQKLTEEEKQQLLSALSELRRMVHVDISGDRIKGKVSFPLHETGWLEYFGVEGERYFNGDTAFKLYMKDNTPHIYIEYIEVNGALLPDRVINEIQNRFIKTQKEEIPLEVRHIAYKIKTIEVTDGKIIITPTYMESTEAYMESTEEFMITD